MRDVPHALGHLGNAYARRGLKAEAHAVVPRLKDHADKTGIGRYETAPVYAGVQENDKGLTYIKVDPCLDPLTLRRSLCPAGPTRRYPHKLNSSSGLAIAFFQPQPHASKCNRFGLDLVSINRGAR